ncbi:osmotically inducible protein OsmC [Janibacter sp. Soil728]|uniref:OsmC family protein n=1 Tax=Janibacter sp. Soil728 TaxID=1736393 RepID=UPI0006FB4A4C|nr:OsmC family protein [Janibacter sp. Soil728]KRE37770.1 osmotically inducible protein OsmC [Janibacter sp. Soil728]
MSAHTFTTSLRWSGSTAVGYDGYPREHGLTMSSHDVLASSDAAFGGDAQLPNPEQLLVAAASSCQMLSFLAVAARARLDVVEYRDEAVGEMPEDNRPMWVTRIVLRPRITLGNPAPRAKVQRLVDVAHRECFIAQSVRSEIVLEPTFRGLVD